MPQMSPPQHDRGHDRPQSLAGDATILHQRGFEVQPLFRAIPRQIGVGERYAERVLERQLEAVAGGPVWTLGIGSNVALDARLRVL